MTKKISKEDFANRMTTVLNHGALNLAIAIGYRTRLFDVMDGFDVPVTAAGIAEKAGLNLRYVTEWLSIMVCGEVIQLISAENGENRFLLPTEYADFLTRRAGNANLGVYTQEIPLLTTCALEPVLAGFRSGDGVSYQHYPEFQGFMTQLADAKHRRVLVETFLPSVADGQLVRDLKCGIRVCDMGCAEGLAINLMAAAFPKSEFVGVDISTEALQSAEAAARQQGLSNVRFLKVDAATLKKERQLENHFDYVTAFDAVHDQTQPLEALKGIYTILKPDGLFSMVDIAASSYLEENKRHPMGPFLYTISLMHCMPVGLADGGAGLGMMWGRQKAEELLNEAGFHRITVAEIPEDPFNDHFLCQK